MSATNEDGVVQPLSSNVKVFGSFHFAESCVFDPERNLILVVNSGVRSGSDLDDDGYISLINPDGSVHTSKWIGVSRDNLDLVNPLGSAIRNGVLYVADMTTVRSFDLESGQPLNSFEVEGSTFLNGIAVDDEGTAYISNTRENGMLFKVTADGESTLLIDGAPLNAPNGVAIDNDGNVVVVNIGNNDVMTFSPDGELLKTEHAVEGGNDGVVILEDDTKYVSSVRFGSVSRIAPGEEAEMIASGIPSAASMCYDSVQHQLVIPMNPNNAVAFIPL
ncbi:MAG: SMP-30/gluconolactonase/LRE family protein, partial [Pseudomonadales bacterium]